MELEELSLSAAASAIARGEVAAEAYAQALLARCAKGAALNAFIQLEPETVRAAARRADERRRRGDRLGPLHGVPLAIKDNLDTADYPTTGGTPGLASNRPKRNAPVVQKLLDAGALVLGKANMHELAYGVTNNNAASGAARNPYDPARIPGGSSGGTGVAVAARFAPAGIGSDTGGSVRIPCAFNGLVGLKVTFGRISLHGTMLLSWTLDSIGPMARSVEDCALLLNALAAPDPRDPTTLGQPLEDFTAAAKGGSIEGMRVALPDSRQLPDTVHPDVASAWQA